LSHSIPQTWQPIFPDKRNYVTSNQRILATGWKPAHSLDDGIRELIKGYTILKNSVYANV
jgi:nucleoside-diphosphate-sugar epimerase